MKNVAHHSGFTLVELLIVLVIVGVLAAVAVPSYQSYALKGHRNQAQILVQNLAQRQEEYYKMYQRYGSLAEMELAGLDTYLADKGKKLTEGAEVLNGRFVFSTINVANDSFKFQLKAINAQLADKDCLFIRTDETSLFNQNSEGADSFCSST